jgi:hypothetical protein
MLRVVKNATGATYFGNYTGTYDADYYTKGKYKYSQRPTMTAQSMASEAENDNLSALGGKMSDADGVRLCRDDGNRCVRGDRRVRQPAIGRR